MTADKVFIIGCGYVGLPLAIQAAKSGYYVTGFDTNLHKISSLQAGKSESPEVSSLELIQLQESGQLQFVSTLENQTESAIFVIAVPTPLDSKRKPDLSMLDDACARISSVIFKGSLVINESTSYIGTLQNFIKPKIIAQSGIEEIDFAVAPERIDPANTRWKLKNTPRIVGGVNEKSLNRSFEFYIKFCDIVLKAPKVEIAEAAKLFENTYRQVNIALANELTGIANAFNISSNEIIEFASTKPYGFMPFYPGVGVGGHCIPIDPSYLSFSADCVGVETKLINLANEINLINPHKVAQLIYKFFNGDIKGKKIQFAGISYKPNVSDLRESPVLELIDQLLNLGGIISWCDPLVSEWNGQRSIALHTEIDLGIITTPHDLIDFEVWRNSRIQVIDLSASSKNYGWAKFL